MARITRSESEACEKPVETALFQAEKAMPPDEREDFEEYCARSTRTRQCPL